MMAFMVSRPARNIPRPRMPRAAPPRLAARRKIMSWLGVSAPRPWMIPMTKTERVSKELGGA